jgi:hypothetical protein
MSDTLGLGERAYDKSPAIREALAARGLIVDRD